MVRTRLIAILLVLAVLGSSCTLPVATLFPAQAATATNAPTVSPTIGPPSLTGGDPMALARAKIKHVIVIMQENRSFDQYFGTFPGANGFPAQNGQFTVCVNDPRPGKCVYPYHDASNENLGGPHGSAEATADIDSGKMDGFIAQAESGKADCQATDIPDCGGTASTDVMGYHDAREIPNYWTYAENFVLQDHLFEPNASWSLPQHLFMVSEWSAKCAKAGDPMSCINALQSPRHPPDFQAAPELPENTPTMPGPT